jgi:hypothetical protein
MATDSQPPSTGAAALRLILLLLAAYGCALVVAGGSIAEARALNDAAPAAVTAVEEPPGQDPLDEATNRRRPPVSASTAQGAAGLEPRGEDEARVVVVAGPAGARAAPSHAPPCLRAPPR